MGIFNTKLHVYANIARIINYLFFTCRFHELTKQICFHIPNQTEIIGIYIIDKIFMHFSTAAAAETNVKCKSWS